MGLQEEFKQEQRCQNIGSNGYLTELTTEDVDCNIAQHAEDNTIGDAICQWHHNNTYECRNSLQVVVEIDLRNARHHHQTYEDQHRSCCRAWQ